MKTSFYFVLWILIYPILDLFNNSFVNNNAFVVAVVIVWGLSKLLNWIMPKTLTYERTSQIAPILEEVYTGDIIAFAKRVSRDMWVETLTAIYFITTTIVIIFVITREGVNDWLALAIFIYFSFGAIIKSINLIKARWKLKNRATLEQCMKITETTYQLDYSSFYESHAGKSYHEMFPPKPKYFKAFELMSMLFAVVTFCLGLVFIVRASMVILDFHGIAEAYAISIVLISYGSLAVYFGVMDFISCLHKK